MKTSDFLSFALIDQCPVDRWRAKPQRLRILPRLDQVSN